MEGACDVFGVELVDGGDNIVGKRFTLCTYGVLT